jgi:hypothetical protein
MEWNGMRGSSDLKREVEPEEMRERDHFSFIGKPETKPRNANEKRAPLTLSLTPRAQNASFLGKQTEDYI